MDVRKALRDEHVECLLGVENAGQATIYECIHLPAARLTRQYPPIVPCAQRDLAKRALHATHAGKNKIKTPFAVWLCIIKGRRLSLLRSPSRGNHDLLRTIGTLRTSCVSLSPQAVSLSCRLNSSITASPRGDRVQWRCLSKHSVGGGQPCKVKIAHGTTCQVWAPAGLIAQYVCGVVDGIPEVLSGRRRDAR